jgi:hypothetical protein
VLFLLSLCSRRFFPPRLQTNSHYFGVAPPAFYFVALDEVRRGKRCLYMYILYIIANEMWRAAQRAKWQPEKHSGAESKPLKATSMAPFRDYGFVLLPITTQAIY